MSIDDCYQLVRRFHNEFALPAPTRPTFIDPERVSARSKWIIEEAREFEQASDLVGQADALLDVIYLALGGLVEMGLQPDQLFRIVHNANMSKLWHDGKPRLRSDGKLLKPRDWTDPKSLLAEEIDKQSSGL